jgi:phospholipid-binding lipoprotein MlaA
VNRPIRSETAPLAALLLLLCALAATGSARAEDSAGAGVVDGSGSRAVYDPWEPMNRAIFAFNEFADRWVVEPLAIGWDTVVPGPVQRGIDHFFDNLASPRRIANSVLQGNPRKAGSDFGRFLINTTFGLAGFFDPAGAAGFPPADEDFGQTLGVWGVPPGPYLVLPVLGPSSPRDTAGLAVDAFALTPEVYFVPFYVSYSLTGTRLLNSRSLALETVRAERAAAFDFYAAVRSAFVQYRANQVRNRAEKPEEEDEDFYYFEEGDDSDPIE